MLQKRREFYTNILTSLLGAVIFTNGLLYNAGVWTAEAATETAIWIVVALVVGIGISLLS